ncbi:transglutaminase [Flavobacterium psychrophilum]|nr:transglutaminase [Flavobacterium psychrophilum]AOE52310.1 transglutaminase [Flavobacterium psychrophilum]
MKLIQTLLLLLAFTFGASAQDFRVFKVTKEELEEKVHPTDTSASAAILHKLGKTYFMITSEGYWNVVTETVTRIKIYKKDGYKYASDELAYYTGGKNIKVNYTDAYTYNLVGNEIVRTRLKGDGEFKEKISEKYEKRKITMPDVKERCIIEFTSTVINPFFSVFPDWYFQYDIPANYIEYKISIPQYFIYNRYMAGYSKVTKSETMINRPAGKDYTEYVDLFSAYNVKAVNDEAFVNNIENYMPILKHELSSTNFSSSGKKNYSTDWASVSKTIYDDDNFGRELKMDSYYKQDLTELLKSTLSTDDKIQKIFNHVKSTMNWNGYNSYFCDKGVKKAYAAKTGNVAEINLILTAMLREAGLKADPVLVSTRSNGIAMFPSYSAYNYVVAGVETDKGIVLLDATSKYSNPGLLPLRALNWQGRMIRKDGSTKDIDLMPTKSSKEVVSIAAAMDKDGAISGKVRNQKQDYYAYVFRENYADMNEDTYAESLEKKHKGIEIGTYKRTDGKVADKPLLEEYEFTHKNVSDVIGGKIYFSPMLYFTEKQNPFKQDEREFPIDFGYPWQDKYMINITLPEGYVVESLPKPTAVAMEENIGSFKYNAAVQGNLIQISVTLDINYPNVSNVYYKTLKDFYQMVIDKQNEKIVLKRA